MVLGRSCPLSYLCASLLAALFLPLASADEIVERTQSILVEVPVQVTLDGEPVKGLTADNFVILDRGRKQELRGFDVLDLTLSAPGPARPQAPHVSIAARRHFLLLFDLTFTELQSLGRARRAMRDWVESELHPWDLVAVATYSGLGGAKLLLNFTSDREQVQLAIASMGRPEFVDRGSDPLALEIGDPSSLLLAGEEDPAPDGGPANSP